MPSLTLQRTLQILCLILFLFLLALAAFPLVSPMPVDAFLRMDPAAAVGVCLGTRTLVPAFWPAAAFLVMTIFLGRFFCGYVCPLGTVIDAADASFHRKRRSGHRKKCPGSSYGVGRFDRWKRLNVLVLCFIAGAALLGVSFVFLVAPIVLVTRFFGLLVYPIISFLADAGLTVVRPLADAVRLPGLAYLQIDVSRYALQWFTLTTMVVILAAGRLAPRFWCRYICPAGAAFALFSRRPFFHRRVSEACVQCGECLRKCPMGAIPDDPFQTDFSSCITCHACERICPTEAVSFGKAAGSTCRNTVWPERRRMLLAGLAGAGGAMVALTGLSFRRNDNAPGQIHPANLIRPPGAVPERNFLIRCIRCGECMKACPTNTLQPIGLAAGIEGFFSPKVVPRHGPCEPLCNVCGQVCPTGAIRAIPPREKIWAKIGTAHILRQKCLAWEFNRGCLVCDEVCPYDAISLRTVSEAAVPVPFVNESRCSGCGFCEHYCPVQARAAIIVEPMEALRLQEGSFREKGQRIGLDLSIGRADRPGSASKSPPTDGLPEEDLPPGFTE